MSRQGSTRSSTLRIDLLDTSPPVWRELQVRADTRLSKLHRIIQTAMGWHDIHLHEFHVGDLRYGVPDDLAEPPGPKSEKSVRLIDIVSAPGLSFRYVYDFGDEWRHGVTVLEIGAGDEATPRALCTAGSRACPPEDCGGPPGYAEILAVLADRRHHRFREVQRWVGGHFDPAAFDIDAVNARLAAIR